MAAPKIKIHLVPDLSTNDYLTHPDIQSGNDFADLIERACDYTKLGTQPGWIAAGVSMPPEFMIKLKPIAVGFGPGARIYEIDIGPGAYHDTNDADFFGTASGGDDDNSSNIAIPAGLPAFTLQKWLFNKLDFGIANPPNLNFEVFALKQSQYVGIPGGGAPITDSEFTFIPRFGGYSFTVPQGDEFEAASAFWGDHTPVFPNWNPVAARFDWDGAVNYAVNTANNTILFSDFFYDNYITEVGAPVGGYDIYVRCFILRDSNTHSASLCGALNPGFVNRVYYALPHHDLVDNQSPAPDIIVSDGASPTLIKESGLVEFDNADFPASGETVEVGSVTAYEYHTWLRMANDFTNDFIFRTYEQGGEDKIAVFSSDNGGLVATRIGGHFNAPPENPEQGQLAFPSFSWADVKVTNEIDHDIGDPPTLSDFFIDALPRAGQYADSTIDNEEIAFGLAGLVDDQRPWDHQEGSRNETDVQCYIRATFDLDRLRLAPKDVPGFTGNPNFNYNKNPMSKMNGEQSFRIRRWYLDSPNNGHIFQLNQGAFFDNIMADDQNDSGNETPVALFGEGHPTGANVIYARITYVLYNDDNFLFGTEIPVANALKTWSIAVRGSFIGET